MRNKLKFKKIVRGASGRMFAAAMALFLLAPPAHAEGLGEILKRLTGVGNDAIWFMQVGAIVIGIGLIIGGIMLLVKDAKSQGTGPVGKGGAAIIIFCGALLAFVGSLIDTAGDTVWGDGQGDRGRIEIPQ